MARTALAVQDIVRTGLNPSFTAANVDGHAIQNDGRTVLYVKTVGGAGCTVTILTPGTIDSLAVADRAVVIGTPAERVIGPFPPMYYDQPGGQEVHVDFTAVAGVTVAALRI
jgi:hypothetical protein